MFALFGHSGGTRGAFDEQLIDIWRQLESASYFEPVEDRALWAGVDERTGNVSELWSWLSRHDLARPEAATLFRDVELTREPLEGALSLEDYLARIRTTNAYLHLTPADQQRLEEGAAAVFDANGSAYTASYSAILVTARRA